MPLQLRVSTGASRLVGRLQRRWQDAIMGQARRASMSDDLNWFWADQRADGSWFQFYLEFSTACNGEAPFYELIGESVAAGPDDYFPVVAGVQ